MQVHHSLGMHCGLKILFPWCIWQMIIRRNVTQADMNIECGRIEKVKG